MSKKTIQKILLCDVALIIVSIVMWILGIKSNEGASFDLANSVLVYGMCVSAAIAIFYILVGCSKQYGFILYKVYFNIFALIELASLSHIQAQTAISAMMICIRFSCLIMLSHGQDLGATRTKIIGHALLATTIVDLLESIMSGYFAYSWKGLFVEAVLEMTCLLFIMAKYIDKKERGSK